MTNYKKHAKLVGTALLASGLLFSAAITTVQAAPATAPASTVSADQQTYGMKDFNKMKRMLKKLNLTAEQQVQVDQLIDKATPEATKLHEEMHANMMKIKEISYSSNYDAKEISALSKHQGDLLSQMLILRAKLNSDIFKILTPEQQQQLRTMMEEKAARKAAKQK